MRRSLNIVAASLLAPALGALPWLCFIAYDIGAGNNDTPLPNEIVLWFALFTYLYFVLAYFVASALLFQLRWLRFGSLAVAVAMLPGAYWVYVVYALVHRGFYNDARVFVFIGLCCFLSVAVTTALWWRIAYHNSIASRLA